MRTFRSIALLGVMLLLEACFLFSSNAECLHSDFHIGMKKAAILSQFGPPDLERTYFKNSPVIWGPIEGFWPEIPQGAKVQVWSYKCRATLEVKSSNLTAGTTELYFVNDSEFAGGIGFAPQGVVYEAGD